MSKNRQFKHGPGEYLTFGDFKLLCDLLGLDIATDEQCEEILLNLGYIAIESEEYKLTDKVKDLVLLLAV